MGSIPPLELDEVLLRRVPPSRPECRTIEIRPDGSERVTSVVMSPRSHEEALSCSRLRFTTPLDLLANLRQMSPPIDPTGWKVCCLFVSDIQQIEDGPHGRLEVLADPRLEPPVDLGHCGIYGAQRTACPRNKLTKKRLADAARILTPTQMETLHSGSTREEILRS